MPCRVDNGAQALGGAPAAGGNGGLGSSTVAVAVRVRADPEGGVGGGPAELSPRPTLGTEAGPRAHLASLPCVGSNGAQGQSTARRVWRGHRGAGLPALGPAWGARGCPGRAGPHMHVRAAAGCR